MTPYVGGTTRRLVGDEPADIARAADILRTGGLVAFPTETVYGLGADAANDAPWRGFLPPRGDLPTIR